MPAALERRPHQPAEQREAAPHALVARQQHLERLIEAGGRDDYLWIHIPVGYLYCIGNPRTDWLYSTEADPGLNGRTLRYPRGKVLEIGTGCGYQAAVLSLLADEVYSIERIRPLHDMARAKLRPFRINNLRLIYGDGILGLPQAAPFDGIILAAAGLGIPDALLDQLAIGGRLVAPVAKNEKEQQLVLVERMSSQRYQRTVLDEVFFVPLQSGVV